MEAAKTGRIIAMGGGGFSMEESPLLDDFVLSLSRRQPARVCFLPTASGDSPEYLTKFYRALGNRCVATDVTLAGSPLMPRHPPLTSQIAEIFEDQDVLYVGGGNTLHLLTLWRAHGLDRLLREAWRRGAVLCGVSAGMNCWFQACITDSFGGLSALNDGLGLLEGSACPHYDGESERRAAFHRALIAGTPSGFAADDGAALHFSGTTLVEAVSSRPDARAYRVGLRDGAPFEEVLPTRFLG